MDPCGLGTVDWAAPWLAPFAEHGRRLAQAPDWRDELDRLASAAAVQTARGLALRFVPPDTAEAAAYEARIAATGAVPTRANLHDAFNALVWLCFPLAKARLNALQAAAIARDGIGAQRGALRDAATLFDESGLLLVTDRRDLIERLRAHDWRALFVEASGAWTGGVRPIAFGHALLEKLVRPYPAICAHALHLALPAGAPLAAIDAALSDALDEQLTPRALAPLPVLGIPGWWPANADPHFYDDARVFRPRRL